MATSGLWYLESENGEDIRSLMKYGGVLRCRMFRMNFSISA